MADPPPGYPDAKLQLTFLPDSVRVWSDGRRELTDVIALLRLVADAFESGELAMTTYTPVPKCPACMDTGFADDPAVSCEFCNAAISQEKSRDRPAP